MATRLVKGPGGITDPVIELVITPHDNEVFEKVGLVDIHLDTNTARLLGFSLLGLAMEAEAQSGYILALRTIKEDEEKIMETVQEATGLIAARRATRL